MNLKFKTGLSQKLNSIPVQNGAIYITSDTHELYMDNNNTRNKILSKHQHGFKDIFRKNTEFWSNSIAPIDRTLFNTARACRTAFLPAKAIIIEYSDDGGKTWTQETSNEKKISLFMNKPSQWINIGKGEKATLNCQTRVTISALDRYAEVDTFYCLFSSQGASCVCTIENSTIGKPDNFTIIQKDIPIAGWSGPNEIYFSPKRFGGSPDQTSNGYKYRFTFKTVGLSSNPKYTSLSQIADLRLYGNIIWGQPNSISSFDTIYDWDAYQNVIFPSKIQIGTLGHSPKNETISKFIVANNDNWLAYKNKTDMQQALEILPLSGGSLTGPLSLRTQAIDHDSPMHQCLTINCETIPTTTIKNAPGIGFHIAEKAWANLVFMTDNSFRFVNSSFTGYCPVYASSFEGNATSATKLNVPKMINGTNFDGTNNITTLKWGTSREITIGNTKKSIDGSTNISWTLNEIGAAPINHTHNYLPLSGGTLTGNVTGKYFIGTCLVGQWLQSTANNKFNSKANKIAVFDESGWLYYRTPEEVRDDIGATATGHNHDDRYYTETEINNIRKIHDTRSQDNTPDWYFNNYEKKVSWEFKYCSTIKLPITNNETYCSLSTYTPWGGPSGGYSVQVARPNKNAIYTRYGINNEKWSEWAKIYSTAFKPTPSEIGAPTETGKGASGTWGINITGNAATATTAKKINYIANAKEDTYRPVWFSYGDSNRYGELVHNDKFQYNPNKDILKVGNISLQNSLTVLKKSYFQDNVLFTLSGDATLKFYALDGGHSYGNEDIAIQSCFDKADGETSNYVDAYSNRCNIILQPRNGQVGIGGKNESYKLYVNGQSLIDGNFSVTGEIHAKKAIYSKGTEVSLIGHTHTYKNIHRNYYDNWASCVAPIDRALFDVNRACRTAFLPDKAIKIEYSNDGGKTWIQETNSDKKRGLFSLNRTSTIYFGDRSSDIPVSTLLQTRVTIEPIDRYCYVDTFYCWMSTSGSSCVCDIERSTIGDKDTFTTIRSNVNLSGWSGPNEIHFSPGAFGGNPGQSTNNYKYRFTFRITAINSNNLNSKPYIEELRLYGDSIWTAPNNMSKHDHIYSWDINQNAIFPKGIKAIDCVSVGQTFGTTLGNYKLYVEGTSWLRGDIWTKNLKPDINDTFSLGAPNYIWNAAYINNPYIKNNIYMTQGSTSIIWNSGTYWQKISTVDNSTPDTPAFLFKQSSNKDSAWETLLSIYDNGKLFVAPNSGGYFKMFTEKSSIPALCVGAGDFDVDILRVNAYSTYDSNFKYKDYGYSLRYIGTGGNIDNLLTLYADNTTNTETIGWSINQCGKIGIGQIPNNNYALAVKGKVYISESLTANLHSTVTLNITTSLSPTWKVIDIPESISTGTYAISIHSNGGSKNGIYDTHWSGIMSWHNGNSNGYETDEIPLHAAGHARNSAQLFLRTHAQPGHKKLLLEMCSNQNIPEAVLYTIKMVRLIEA